MMMLSSVCLLLLLAAKTATAVPCVGEKHEFNPFVHKKVYKVGVHAHRGMEAAMWESNMIFSEYLTMTAGQRFDPPIRFEIIPSHFDGLFELIENEEMDFLYANPGVYSCIGTEAGASALATTVRRVQVRDKEFELDVYGGVIAVRADNEEINSVLDLKDKVIGMGGIVSTHQKNLFEYLIYFFHMLYESET